MKELLAAKLAVMEKVRRVEKGKKMATASGGYQYVGIDDLVGEIRPAMVVNGLSLIPSKSEMLVNDRLQLAGGKTMTHVIVKMTYRLAHISGQFEEAEAIGEGADSMDKAASKAQTAALKYALLHTFLLQGAHDDPDDYASQDQEPRQQAKPEPKPVAQKPAISQFDELKNLAHGQIKGMSKEQLGDSFLPFVEEAKRDAEVLPMAERPQYVEVVKGYWIFYRIGFIETKQDADKVSKVIDNAGLNVNLSQKLREALTKHMKAVAA